MSARQYPAGYVFRLMREAHGLTTRAVASAVGVSPGYVSRVERGRARPSRALTGRLCAFYGAA